MQEAARSVSAHPGRRFSAGGRGDRTHGGHPEIGYESAMERLTPLGKAVVLAFAAGLARRRVDHRKIAIVLVHKCVLNSGYRSSRLASVAGISKYTCVDRWCGLFRAFLREMIETGRLRASALLEV